MGYKNPDKSFNGPLAINPADRTVAVSATRRPPGGATYEKQRTKRNGVRCKCSSALATAIIKIDVKTNLDIAHPLRT